MSANSREGEREGGREEWGGGKRCLEHGAWIEQDNPGERPKGGTPGKTRRPYGERVCNLSKPPSDVQP